MRQTDRAALQQPGQPGIHTPDATRLAALEEENRHLKTRLAEALLDIETLREMLTKTG